MKVFLLYPDKNFDMKRTLPAHWQDLCVDLGLDVILSSMSNGDRFLHEVSTKVLSLFETDIDVLIYRQEILKDCLNNANVIREMYQIPLRIKEQKRQNWLGIFGPRNPSNVLTGARNYLEILIDGLSGLRKIADTHYTNFNSRGFKRFFKMIIEELTDEYLNLMRKHTEELKFSKGIWASVQIGDGCEGNNYTLRYPKMKKWLERILNRGKTFTHQLHPRDETGARFLGELRDITLSRAAQSVACATEHIEHFFERLQQEVGFYVACLNLAESIKNLGLPFSFPEPLSAYEKRFEAKDLYDLSLALVMKKKVVGNDLRAQGKNIFMIMGANRGGKTTFLRSVGQAQIMMQTGMFVPASTFTAPIHFGVFSHFKREEDREFKKGKFEEELSRMSETVNNIKPYSMLLLNESFSSTNEYEGSEIAYQVVKALSEESVTVFFVTHMYELASRFVSTDNTMFLQAERTKGGQRTFRIKEGGPVATSFAEDVYKKLFKEQSTDNQLVHQNR